MKKLKSLFLLGCSYFAATTSLSAQSSIVASGTSASGAGGSVSNSIGQVAYISAKAGDAQISQGVQQAYEIYTLAIDHPVFTDVNASVFPNPAQSILTLQLADFKGHAIVAQLIDATGKLVAEKKLTDLKTEFDVSAIAAGHYILSLYVNLSIIKSFKITKN